MKINRQIICSFIFVVFLVMVTGLASATTYAYVPNSMDNNISVIDTATNKVIASVSVGDQPYGIAITPDGKKVYVANQGSNTVSVIDAVNLTVTAAVPVGISPLGVAVSPDGTKIYITNSGSNNVSIIATNNDTIIGTINGEYGIFRPAGITASPDGTKLYVVSSGYGGSVCVIDSETSKDITTVNVGHYPVGIAITPDGTKAYVTNHDGSTVSVIDTVTNTVIATVPGVYGDNIVVSPDGTRIYVENPASTIHVIDTATNNVIATLNTVMTTSGISINKDGTKIYVANDADNTVSVIDVATNIITASVNVGMNPKAFGQFISPSSVSSVLTGINLSLSMRAPTSIDQGSSMTYILYYSNFGNGTAQNVILEDRIPDNVTFESASDGGIYDLSAGTVRWNIGIVEPNGHGYRTLNVSIPPDVAVRTAIVNKAKISISNIQALLDNNEAQAKTTVTDSTLPPKETSYMIDFEDPSFQNEEQIKDHYLGLMFSDGVRISKNSLSNPPYWAPYSGNSVAYFSDVNRIDFDQPVSWVSLRYHSVTNATLEAYDGSGALISRDTKPPTTGGRLQVTGPNIAYVLIYAYDDGHMFGVNIGEGDYYFSDAYMTIDDLEFLIPVDSTNFLKNAAAFSAFPVFGRMPLNVLFTDMSIGFPTSWYWDFGDGTNSIEQNPTHNYYSAGNYTVNLTISNAYGTDLKSSEINIQESKGPYAYIPNYLDKDVSIIDTQLNRVLSTVPLEGYPVGITVSQDGNWVYVTQMGERLYGIYGTYYVSAINTATNEVKHIYDAIYVREIGPNNPGAITVSPDGRYVYFFDTVAMIKFDTVLNTYVTVTGGSRGVVFSPDGTKYYVANQNSNTISIIDTATGKSTQTVGVGNDPYGVAVTPDGTKVYVANYGSNSVSVIDTSANTVTATIELGSNPYGVAVSPDGTKVYVTNSGSNNVYVIDTSKNTVTASVAVGISPYGISVNRDGTKVYVANYGSNNVSIIDTSTNTVTATVDVGNGPIAFGKFISSSSILNNPKLALSNQAPINKERDSSMTYTLYYCNSGTAANDVFLKDKLPNNVTFKSASDGGVYDSSTRTVRWDIGLVNSTGRGYRTFSVSIPKDVPVDTIIVNNANIGTSDPETQNSNVEASANTRITGLELPPGVGIEPTNGATDGLNSVNWQTPVTFSYHSVRPVTAVRIHIHPESGADIDADMSPATDMPIEGTSDWLYTTTLYPRHGRATVTYTVNGGVVESPQIYSRTDWGCPDGEYSRGTITHSTPNHIIIHHTDTPNTRTDYAQEVLDIWHYHVYDNGWVDIGYNYLIDPNGVIYEGRAGGENVVGAHAYNENTGNNQNPGTVGIAFLGTFSNDEPTPAALRSAENLIAYICNQNNIDPLGHGINNGLDYNNIAGHRDVDSTQCPGDSFYNLFPVLRQHVNNLIGSTITFDIYIDPAGYIYDIDTEQRIAGASVWLQSPDSSGSWQNISTGQNPPISQPDINPLTSDQDGMYQWDTLPGIYRVHVEAPGYEPGNSIMVSVPPPVTDLHVGLHHIYDPNVPPILPTANFSTDVGSGYAPLSVQFTDLSENATGRIWNFGDGTSSYDRYPIHTYSTAGTYTVKLTASNGNGVNSKTGTIDVQAVPIYPVANFICNVTEGYAPLSVQFTGLSENVNEISWDFGDGTSSTDKSPVHTYLVTGNYTATLTVSNNNGTSSTFARINVSEQYVTPPQSIVVEVGSDQTVEEGATVNFEGSFTTSGSHTYSYHWDFGDGSVEDSSLTTSHVYADDGVYTVNLTVTDEEGSFGNDTLLVTVNNVIPSVNAGSDIVVTAGDPTSLMGNFSDLGWFDTHIAEWNFGEGAIETGSVSEENEYPDSTGTVSGSFSYFDAGEYTVTLNVTDDDGGIEQDQLTVTVRPIEAEVTFDPETFNLNSTGDWVTAYIEPPAAYGVLAIDIGSVLLNSTVPAVSDPKYDFVTNESEYLTDLDLDGISERMFKFNRGEVAGILKAGDKVTVTFIGKVEYNNGISSGMASFEGSDVIRVTQKDSKKDKTKK